MALLRRLGLRNFVADARRLQAGHAPTRLVVPGLPLAAPLICYEAIFPGEVLPERAPVRGPACFSMSRMMVGSVAPPVPTSIWLKRDFVVSKKASR